MDFSYIFSDPTFWVAVSFFLFFGFLFWKKVPGMIARALDERADKIKAQLEEARTLKEEAQVLLAQYQRKHRDAEKEAEAMMVLAREEAELFARDAERNLTASFERQLKATGEKISQAESHAVKEVKNAAAAAALGAAAEILENQLKAGKHTGLIDDAIKDLDKRLN